MNLVFTKVMTMFRGRFLFHPSRARIQCCLDHALNLPEQEAVQRHLQECPDCRRIMNAAAKTLEWMDHMEQKASPEMESALFFGRGRLEAALRSGSLDSSLPAFRPADTSSLSSRHMVEKAARELEAYLGRKLLKDLCESHSGNPLTVPNLLREAEPFLTTFLGSKSAAQIRCKIVTATTGTSSTF